MTDQPPPPPYPPIPPPGGDSYPPPLPGGGFYPPPPPAVGGYVPAPPGPAIRALPKESYAAWHTRALALLIDYLPAAVIAVGVGSAFGQDSGSGQAAGLLVNLIVVAYLIWNYGYRQVTTGSSLGKSVLKIQVLSEATGQPIGFGMSIVRQLAHFVDGLLFYIGYLFPLWDAKRQTLADKIMSTVVLPIPAG